MRKRDTKEKPLTMMALRCQYFGNLGVLIKEIRGLLIIFKSTEAKKILISRTVII